MKAALFYLIRRSFVNRLRFRVSRLKSPRYFIPTAIGLAYFSLIFLSSIFQANRDVLPHMKEDMQSTLEAGLMGVVLLGIATTWIFARRTPAFCFTEAEVQILFAAPLTRKELILFRLTKAQPGLLFMSVVFCLFRCWFQKEAPTAFTIPGFWMLLNVGMLHQAAASLTMASLLQHGVTGIRRHLPVLTILTVALGSMVLSFHPPGAGLEGKSVFVWMKEVLSTGPAGVILWPVWQVVLLPCARDVAAFSQHLIPSMVLAGLLFAWVIRSDIAFEEAAVSFAKKRSAALEAARRGRGVAVSGTLAKKTIRKSFFPLAELGPTWRAITWKNLVATKRNISPGIVIAVVTFLVMFAFFFFKAGVLEEGTGKYTFLPAVAGVIAIMLTFVGPTLLREDVRADLEHMDLLKTFPMSGRAILRGEACAGALLVMPLQILLVVLFTLGNLPEGIHAFTLAQRVSCAGAALFVLPSLTFLSFVLENGMAVLFPAWVLVDRGAPAGASSRGIESMGLGIVTTGGRMIALVFLLIPATIVGGVVFAAGYPVVNVGAIAAGGLAAAVTLFGETELLLAWFGSRLESLDPATENI